MKRILFLLLALVLSTCSREPIKSEAFNTPGASSRADASASEGRDHKPNRFPSSAARQDKAWEARKEKAHLNVPLIKQNPELKYGCEVTSLTMLLRYAGISTGKMALAAEMPKDRDGQKKTSTGDILRWGDPKDGFVGDVTGDRAGYAIYDKPLEGLMRRYLGSRTVNLTGKPFARVLRQLSDGRPVVVWTTGDYRLPDRWETWKHGDETIRTPLDLHAVVLVGYDADSVYVNDPLSGEKAHRVPLDQFTLSWNALGKRALSYN